MGGNVRLCAVPEQLNDEENIGSPAGHKSPQRKTLVAAKSDVN